MLIDLINELISPIIGLFFDRRRVRFTVHKAFFRDGKECFFLNVTNLSKDRKIVITHIWFGSDPQIPVIQKSRLLPKTLEPDEPWETWIETKNLPKYIRNSPYDKAKLRLSNGKTIKSKENIGVPEQGTVLGGPIDNT